MPQVRCDYASALRVFCWVRNGQRRSVQAGHAPVEVRFSAAADLRAQLEKFLPCDRWGVVVARKRDLGMLATLHDHTRSLDFDAALVCFCTQLRARGRSRFELDIYERPTP
ncbi:MAG: hypothetical protein EBR09_17225 [Proteobacteria bacterium]|jgi:hypothetical protein|nr:hypothetical protein [Pseudomonadota bacterium]